MKTPSCCICNKERGAELLDGSRIELRPYGPKGADICFQCMMASEELQRTAEKQFDQVLDSAEPGGVVILGAHRPVVVKPQKE